MKVSPQFVLSHFMHPLSTLRGVYERVKFFFLLKTLPLRQLLAIRRLHNKRPLKCVFFVVYYQTWKFEEVYKRMSVSPDFDPIILICPIVNYGREKMLLHLREGYRYFKDANYNVILSYDENSNEYINVSKDINPDIIFYTNPYKGLIDDRYYITNYLNYLTVYVPYAFNNNADLDFCHNLPLHNFVWRYYAESDEHKHYSEICSLCKGRNVVTTGYPGIERFLSPKIGVECTDWKVKEGNLKRIIWAPHHSIGTKGSVVYSCFLKYADFMLHMAEKYQDSVQFVFKPHPILKSKLDLLWGESVADEYYRRWREMPNTSINDGEYCDLFLSSDAMIHDSGSFLIEYLYINKPVLRTLNDIPLEELYNSFARKCLKQYYMAYQEDDIEQFILNVLNGVDPLKEQRTQFVNDMLMPKGSPSQNIIEDLLDSIDNHILFRN